MSVGTNPPLSPPDSLQAPKLAPAPPQSGGSSASWIVLFALLLGILAAVFAFSRISSGGGDGSSKSMLTHTMERGELVVTVTEEGNVESASNIEVKCQVAGGSSILWIVEDGTQVKQGDKLVELDSSALEEQINTQRIAFERARSTKIQAEKNFSVAKIAVTEYLEGTFKQALQDAEAQITIAEENLRSAKNSLEHAEKMFRKGYVSSLELEGTKFSVDRAELELGSASTARDVLVKFTKEKTLEDLRSQRDNAEAQMKSDAAAFDLEATRLRRLEDQLTNCTINAPQDGMVVYANERSGRFGQTSASIEEGAAVRERQTILRLPDLQQMQVKVNVHESKVDDIQIGMPARIRILEKEMTGVVTSVANQPEPTSFFSGNVKEYATQVRVTDQGAESLRPGMTAEVEILVAHLENVLPAPVAAVVENRGKFFGWVKTDAGPEIRPLLLGPSDDRFVEVKDGVAEGEEILLNPRAIVAEARSLGVEEEPADVEKKFGKGGGPAGLADGGPRGGPGAGRPGGGAGGPGMRGGDGRQSGPDGGRAGRGGPGGGLAAMDKDGDGKVSQDEAPEGMRSFFGRLDTDGDGFIDKAEMDAARKRFQAGGGGRPGGGGPGGGGRPDGGGGPG